MIDHGSARPRRSAGRPAEPSPCVSRAVCASETRRGESPARGRACEPRSWSASGSGQAFARATWPSISARAPPKPGSSRTATRVAGPVTTTGGQTPPCGASGVSTMPSAPAPASARPRRASRRSSPAASRPPGRRRVADQQLAVESISTVTWPAPARTSTRSLTAAGAARRRRPPGRQLPRRPGRRRRRRRARPPGGRRRPRSARRGCRRPRPAPGSRRAPRRAAPTASCRRRRGRSRDRRPPLRRAAPPAGRRRAGSTWTSSTPWPDVHVPSVPAPPGDRGADARRSRSARAGRPP